MNPDERWLIWSNEHRAWWRANRWGYTLLIAEAGTYDYPVAKMIVQNANAHLEEGAEPNEVMLPDFRELDAQARRDAARFDSEWNRYSNL